MPYRVSCNHCGAPFSITDELFTRKVKGRLVTIRCKRCHKDMRLDDTGGAVQAPKADSDDGHAQTADAISESGIEVTPTMPLRALAAPAPPKTPETPETNRLEEPPKPLWVVSYGEDDDRELTLLQIRAALEDREIDRDTIVWQEGMPEWLPIAKVKPLAALVPAPVPAAGTPSRSAGQGSGVAVRRPSSRPPPKPEPFPSPKVPVVAQKTVAAAVSDKVNTRPELPKARQKPPLPTRTEPAANADTHDDAPPSSGSPALSTLTRKDSEKKVDAELDDFFLNMQSADRGSLDPPNIDISRIGGSVSGDAALLAAPAAETTRPESRPPASKPPTVGDVERERRRPLAPPRTARQRGLLPWLVLLAAALVGGWLLFRSRWFDAPTANVTTQQVEHVEPTPPHTGDPPPAIAENNVAPEPAATANPGQVTGALPPRPASAPRATPARSGAGSSPSQRSGKAASTENVDSPESEAPSSAATAPIVLSEPAVEKPVSIAAPFDKAAARSSLGAAAAQATSCRKEGDPTGNAVVVVTFAPSGRVTSATVTGPPFAGTSSGGCIASILRRAMVPPFSGDHVTVSKTVVIH